MANWTVAGQEVTFHDALHHKRNRAVVGVEAGPVVDEHKRYVYVVEHGLNNSETKARDNTEEG